MKSNNLSKKNGVISRRAFINRAAAGSALIVAGPATNLFAADQQQEKPWSADATKYRFHMIGHSHIDPVWLWPWTEGISIVHSTFRSTLERMKETPDFHFIASSAQFYEWVAENDPSMLKEIRKRVDEGRWHIIGGWWVEPDMNIPGGEAMVRQGLYGQLTFQRLLGHRATVAFNPDSFGHIGTLPQIIKLQGMDNYVFARPEPREKNLPSEIFWWESPDGTRVLGYRIPFSYTDSRAVKSRVQTILSQYGNQPIKVFMQFYGAGDHGGAATKENIRSINELKTEKGAPVVFYSSPDRYFKEIREDKNIILPVVKDDLQHHAPGCYTAESKIKKDNRQSESAIVTAEKIAAIGSSAWGANYPKGELTTAWQRILFHQFHDSLAGTSLPEHYPFAREGFGYALDTAHRLTYMSLQKLEWQIAAEDPASTYLVLFNPHAWEINGNIEYEMYWLTGKPSNVVDEQGNPLFHQITPSSTEVVNRGRFVVNTKIPAFGYRQIRIMQGEAPTIKEAPKTEGNNLENEFLKVHFSKDGTLGILDKENSKELFIAGESGCKAVVINDTSDTWSHNIKTFSDQIGSFGNATLTVVENGPLRAMVRAISTYGDSKLIIDWILYSGSRNLEARVTLDWREHLKMLKFSFPVDVESPVATYEVPYGHIVRATNGNEDPGQRWIDVSGKRGANAFGLSVINDAKYGYDVTGNDMRISIARSAPYAHHIPKVLDMKAEHLWMDQGIQTFRMLLVPHKDSWQESNIARITEEFMATPLVIYQGIHGGSKPKSDSFLSIDVQNVIVSAIKVSENGDDIILRCVETSGSPTEATLNLKFANRKWKSSFRPCEIKTLRLVRKTGDIKEVNLLEE